jgi:hypothetical protein
MRRRNVALAQNTDLAYEGALDIRRSSSTYAGAARHTQERLDILMRGLRYGSSLRCSGAI